MKKIFILIVIIFLSITTYAQSWKRYSPGVSGDNSFLTIAANNNGIVYAAFRRFRNSGSSSNKDLYVKKFDGTSWSTVGSLTGTDPSYISLAFDRNDTPYVCYRQTTNAVYARKYNGSSWVNLGTNVASGNNQNPDIALDTAGIPYVVYSDNANSGKPVVKKYNSSTNTWSTIAAISTNSCNPVKLVVNSNDNALYAIYRDNAQGSEGVYVKKYNNSSNTWSSIGSRISIGQATDQLSAVIDNQGSLYVAYGDNTLSGSSAGKVVVVKYAGSSWATVGTARFSTGYADGLSIAVNNSNEVHVSYVDQGNSNNVTVKKYNGSSWVDVGVQNFVTADHASGFGTLAFDEYDNVYTGYNQTSTKIEIARYRDGTIWKGTGLGGLSAPYYWDKGEPDDVTDAEITTFGAVDGFTCNNLTISNYLQLNTGETITVKGNFTNNSSGLQGKGKIVFNNGDTVYVNGSTSFSEPKLVVNSGTILFINSNASLRVDSILEVAGTLAMHDNATLTFNTGKLVLNGNTAQTLYLGQTVHKYITIDTMELNNGAGASFDYGVIYIKSEYQPTSGTLISNNRLRLLSSSSGSARIAQGSSSGGYITGNIVGQLYIPGGRRAFRFLAHAAIDTKPLSQFTDNIDITGSGGSANGFTNTTTNNPSAFYFDVTTADNSTAGNNPGWQPFTSATANSWNKGEVMRILIRGSKGEGLTGGSYTPSAVTMDMYEQVNQGDQTVTLTKGGNSNFVLVGNPFPSQVQLNTVSRGSNVGANFYIWDPNQGAKGAYTSHQFSTSYVLPQWGAFVTTVSANSNNTMVFEEADKTGSTPAAQFKTTANNYVLKLSIDDTTYSWDKLLINFDDNGYAVQDKLDAVKLNNPGLDLYTVSQDGTDLSIDVRPLQDREVIPLGVDVWHYGGSGTFTISTEDLNLPAGAQLTFYDKYLNKQKAITDTFSYTFTVSQSDSMSGGKNRFYIGVMDKSTATNSINKETAQMQVYPNPANEELHIAYKGLDGETLITVYDMSGRLVYKSSNSSVDGNGLISIDIHELPKGVYIVQLTNSKQAFVQKIVKQ